MRTLVLSALLVALVPWSVKAQAAPATTAPAPRRVVAPAPPPAAPPPPAVAPAPAAPQAAPLPPPAAPEPVPAPAAPAAPAPPAAAPLPPPPPGYGYGYGDEAHGGYPMPQQRAPRTDLHVELDEIDGRLRELSAERRQVSIVGPIAMMGAGFGVALVSSAIALTGFAVAEGIENDDWWDDYDRNDADWNDDGRVNRSDERAARNTARVFTGFAVVGVGVGVGGSVLLAKRLKQRRANSPEIHDLKERRRDLRRELRYGASVTPDMAQLSVGGRF